MKASARVLLGAATTALGVIPLVFDAFWISKALTLCQRLCARAS